MVMITVRAAHLDDVVPNDAFTLHEYARQAKMYRTEDDVYRSIREWVVAEAGRVVGMGALLIYGVTMRKFAHW